MKAMSYWFRPKYYGYGATPANWKGWLATAVFMALIPAIAGALVDPLRIGAFAALIALFVWIAWKKTDGAWRWRWGRTKERNKEAGCSKSKTFM
jgi:hypothetical protein